MARAKSSDGSPEAAIIQIPEVFSLKTGVLLEACKLFQLGLSAWDQKHMLLEDYVIEQLLLQLALIEKSSWKNISVHCLNSAFSSVINFLSNYQVIFPLCYKSLAILCLIKS